MPKRPSVSPAETEVLRYIAANGPTTVGDESELRLMLPHELTHLKRGDLLWGWLPSVVQAIFFFHPLVGLRAASTN